MWKLVIKSSYFSMEKYFDSMVAAWEYKKSLHDQGHDVKSYEIIKMV